MKKKALSFMLSAILFLSAFTINTSAVQTEIEDYLSSLTEEEKITQAGVFSSEYQSSPFYEKLMTALDDSKDKTTMEKALAAALSQEGYQNYRIIPLMVWILLRQKRTVLSGQA